MATRWHALSTLPGAVRLTDMRLRSRPIYGTAFETYLPIERGRSYRRGVVREWSRPLLGSYLLILVDATNDVAMSAVLGQAGVRGFVKAAGCLLEVRADEIAMLRQLEDARGTIPTKAAQGVFKAGQAVRVTDGPFTSFPGVVERPAQRQNERTNWRGDRVTETVACAIVSVEIFGRRTPVELEEWQLERA